MSNDQNWANLYCQRENVINGRHAWLWLIQTSIGNFAVVQYEHAGDPYIVEKIFREDYDKAEAYFETICKKMVSGKI